MTQTTRQIDAEYFDAVETFVEIANENPRTDRKIGVERAVIQWRVDGDTFHTTFNDGTVSVRAGRHPRPKVTVETDPETLQDLLLAERDITNFVGEGEVRMVAGEEHYHDLILMGRVLSACARDLQEAL